jgi:hypothetical protein
MKNIKAINQIGMVGKSLLGVMLCGSMSYAYAGCYIMGDSIAQGVAKYMHGCSSATEVGLNSNKALGYWSSRPELREDLDKEFIVVSLGVNDGTSHDRYSEENKKTLANLVKIRSSMQAKRVVWILPPKQDKSEVVQRIAKHYNDYVLDIHTVLGKDGIHPTGTGYQAIAQQISNFKNN